MGISQKGFLAAVFIALAWHGALCRPRRDGESCSSAFQPSHKGFGTPFHQATDYGDLECMKEFHAAGADVDAWDRNGEAPILATAFDGNVEALKLLIEFGANLNKVQYSTGTPLAAAACRGFLEYVKVILAAGADKSFTNNAGVHPLDEVCKCGNCSDDTAKQLRDLLGGGCAIMAGVDFPSQTGILNNGKNDITKTNEECCQKCANHPSCKVWTRIKDPIGGSQIGECWLRDFKPSQKPCRWCDSGLNSCGMLGETDFPSSSGILNDGKSDITSSNAECCKKCNERSDCKAWTRIQSDTQFNKAGECWLRNFVPERKFCAECVSGSKA
ncbi:hypothetical protein BSKO_01130 [Bryopsis sp. KO-2023]|nr:hypothetical protein BSKO_01130 [Bryopsis sp. KO-2023]